MNRMSEHQDRANIADASHDLSFVNEDAAAIEFDRRIGRLSPTRPIASGVVNERFDCNGPFEMGFAEVHGYYLTHRPGREQKDARIDRILFPGAGLKACGWRSPIGVELKRSDCDFGPAVSQAIDYTYCVFNVGSNWIYCERIFLFPFTMPHGPLKSVMIQNGVGAVCGQFYKNVPDASRSLVFRLESNQLEINEDRTVADCKPWQSGHKKGAR